MDSTDDQWKVLEPLMSHFRHLVVRSERYALNFLGFVQLECILILLTRCFRERPYGRSPVWPQSRMPSRIQI